MRGQRDDDVGHDVCQHEIIPRAEMPAQSGVGEDVARADGEPVVIKAVERGVARRDLGRLGVDVAPGDVCAAEQQRPDAENAAAAAEVERGLARTGVLLERGEAHARCGVAARAEDEPRIEPQRDAPVRRRIEPFGHDDELFADFDRLIVLPPVILPVAVAHGRGRQLAAEAGADGRKLRAAVVIVREVELDARHAAKLRLERVVHIVPVLMVLLQKLLKIRLVLHDHAAGAQLGQLRADVVDLIAAGGDGHFDPLHMQCSFVRDLPPRAGRHAINIIWYLLIIPRGAALEKWARRLFTHFLACGQKTARSSGAYIGRRLREYSRECIFHCRLQATQCGKMRINTPFL